jgi:hypothetical protein
MRCAALRRKVTFVFRKISTRVEAIFECGTRLTGVAVPTFAALYALSFAGLFRRHAVDCPRDTPHYLAANISRHHDNEICVVPRLCAQLVVR